MKFRYILGVILIGVMSLFVMVIVQWKELPNRLSVETPRGAPLQRSEVLTGREDSVVDTNPQIPTTLETPIKEPIEQDSAIKALTRLVNENFEMAARLYDERLKIQQRRKPNGLYSAQDQKRLQEIHIAVYSNLKAIDEKIEGATQPYLSRRSGTIRCGYYLMPYKLKEQLGVVPEGYYLFQKSVEPFLRKPNR